MSGTSSDHAGGPPPPAARRTGRLVLAAALSLYVATTGGSMATDIMSYEVTKGMVERRSVAMSFNVHGMEAHRGVDGRYYAPYGVGHAIYGVPFYAVGRVAESAIGPRIGRADAVRKAAFVGGSAVASALVVWIVFWFAWRLTGDRRAAAVTALTVGFGTLLWPYAKYGFNAPVATLAITAGVYGVWLGTRAGRIGVLWAGGACLAFAVLVRHELALAAVVAAVWVYFERGRRWRETLRGWVPIGVPAVAAALLTLYYNQVRFGSPWDTGYLRDSTATFGSALEGIVGLIVSPGRSVFLYSLVTVPALAATVAMFRRDRSTAWLLAAQCASLFLFYASLTYWDADRSYGPRYLLPVLPLVCLPLVYSFATWTGRARAWLAVAVLVSVVAQVPGVLVDFTKVGTILDSGRIEIEERRWDWTRSGLTLSTRASLRALPLNARYVAGLAEPPAVQLPEGRAPGFSEQFGYSLDFWWLYLFYLGVLPGPAAVLLGAFCFATAAWLLARVRRSTLDP